MKNILKIVKSDLKGIFSSFFVFIIIIGLCFLPALYAWLNIYANWDPYGNTGNIAIGVVNNDEGWTLDNGDYVNKGQDVCDDLAQKDSIGWVFEEEEDTAMDKLYAGDYYAVLVIDQNFTYGMYQGILDNFQNPTITYYVNDKKNAVATKITDSAASSVQTSINKSYVELLATQVYEESQDLVDAVRDEDLGGGFREKLTAISESLDDYDQMIETFMEANEEMSDVSQNAQGDMGDSQTAISSGVSSLEDSQNDLKNTEDSFASFSTKVTATLTSIESSLNNISSEIEAAGTEDDLSALRADAEKIAADTEDLSSSFLSLYETVQDVKSDDNSLSGLLSTLKSTTDTLNSVTSSTEAAATATSTETEEEQIQAIQASLEDYGDSIESINKLYTNQVVPQVNGLLDSMSQVIESVQEMLNSLSSTAASMEEVFGGVTTTLDALNTSMEEMSGVIESAKDSLDTIIDQMSGKTEEEQLAMMVSFFGMDANEMGEFFAEPVLIETTSVYEIENYGSGVAPFYSTLAIWVGMTILVSILRVHADHRELTNIKHYQMFFGRYILFFILSEFQAAIIVIGDLYLLKIQCLYPLAFFGTAALASLTFSLLVYSLTIAFGDIGKALAVVVMVLQIAGSGGTYPIEALPAFFRGVYIFFPFPYAINAMRECIGGMYQNDYFIYMMELLVFCGASLVIGLIVRIPFIRLNFFIEKRMDDTDMM